MAVRIEQLHLLKENDYNRMTIKKSKEGYTVNIRRYGENLPQVRPSMKKINFFEGVTDSEKISKLVDFFLNNNVLNYVSSQILIPYYDDAFACIKGEKELYFSLKEPLQEEMISKAKDKYCYDREKTIENNSDVKYYKIKVDNVSYYNVVENKYGRQIDLCLLNRRNGLSKDLYLDEMEQEFLKEFMCNKFEEIGEEVKIENKNLYYEGMENYINFGYYIICGDNVIDIDNVELFPEIVSIINNYNKERNVKKKQLKMEGF